MGAKLMTGPALKIDRMLLEIPGGSAAHGRKVAELVAAGLAAAGTLPGSGDLPTLSVSLTARPGADPESLAGQIVEATLRALAREL
jgi:hypothetical protein